MKKVYKKSPDTDQSNQSDIDNSINGLIITPKNTAVKAINCIVGIDVNQLANHLDSDISNKEAGLIKNLVNGKKITVLKSNPLNKEVKHLVNLGIFTIKEVNDHERL